jgi:hypothetical protein
MQINNKVERVLADEAETRANDRALIMKVWEFEGLHLSETQKRLFLEKVSSPESVRRTRQKLQEAGHYLPSKKVQEFRKELDQKTKAEIVNDKVVYEAISWIDKDDL